MIIFSIAVGVATIIGAIATVLSLIVSVKDKKKK
jgi:hypothetical protein